MASAKKQTVVCIDCGTPFASKAARTAHEKHCPVRQSQETKRSQEQLEWRHTRIQRRVLDSYQSAARAFAAYHNGQTEAARQLHGWLAQDFSSALRELEQLNDGLTQAGGTPSPRISKLRADVVLSLEQVQELRSMLARLNRDYGDVL